MAQISVSLPDDLLEKVKAYAEAKGFATLSDVVREALRSVSDPYSFSFSERVAIIAVLELRQSMNPSDEIKRAIEIFRSGYSSEYAQALGHVEKDEIDPAVCRFVHEVFSCYDDIQTSSRELKDDELVKMTEFEGYDGNNEPEYLSYASFLLESGKYTYIRGAVPHLDSHSMKLSSYRRMVERWRQLKTEPLRGLLTRDQILSIVKA